MQSAPESPSSPATSIASPGRASLRRLMCASALRPMAVTLIVMPAAERVVVAPGERDAERFGEFPVAEHELFGPCAGRVGRERQ